MKKLKEVRDGNIRSWRGEVLVDLSDLGYEVKADEKLSSILDDRELKDDQSEPFRVLGLIELNNGLRKAIVFSLRRNLCIDKDYNYTFAACLPITAVEAAFAEVWIRSRVSEMDAEREKLRKIGLIFQAHGLDDESIQKRREVLLKFHNLE